MGSTSTSRCSRPATSRCRDAGEQARRPSAGPLRILFIADVFGAPGRRVLETRLPRLRDELDIDFCIVNGENAADGSGITRRLAARIAEAGADVITTGNHVFRQKDALELLAADGRVIRPANLDGPGVPGRGVALTSTTGGLPVAVVNVQGQLFMSTPTSPFHVIDGLVAEAREHARIVVVDFHAEATSEKIALARLLDGRVTAVIGTHTHVQTNDARVLPGGTAALTDAGMTGPHDSVIGVEAGLAIKRMRTGLPVRFHPAEGGVRIEGALIECNDDGRAVGCTTVRVTDS